MEGKCGLCPDVLASTQTFSSEDKSIVFIEIIPSGQKNGSFFVGWRLFETIYKKNLL